MIKCIISLTFSWLFLENERKSEQAHIPHAPTLLENAVYNEWQLQALVTGNRTEKLHKIILAKVQKGYKLLLKKIKSAFPVKMHIYTLCTCMSFITTKFHEILWSCFRGVVLTNCFIIIFHFGQVSKFKKGVIPRKKWNQMFHYYLSIGSNF